MTKKPKFRNLIADKKLWKAVEQNIERDHAYYARLVKRTSTKPLKRTTASNQVPGNEWRILAHRANGDSLDVRIKPKDKLIFDEFVFSPGVIHIEQMDTRSWWAQIGDARIWIELPAKGAPKVLIERGDYCSCKKRPCKHSKAKMGEYV